MSAKLTPRQNELVSQALCGAALTGDSMGELMSLEKLKELRRTLVDELKAVTAETELEPSSSARSIAG